MKKAWFFAAVVIGWAILSSISFGATYGGGSGTSADPYQIWTPQQMNTIGANSGDWGTCFKLMADIDMSIYSDTQYNIIGYGTPFTGIFDGNGHVIRNLTCTKTGSIPVSLFGKTSSATIKNLGVENINLNVVFGDGWWDSNCVGGLVGNQNQGTIANCYTTGTVSSSNTTYGCYSYSCSGGLAGYQNYGTIVNCYSTVAVSSFSRTYENYSNSWAGGLVGVQENGTITNCYGTGSVTSASVAPPSDASGTAAFSEAGGLLGEQQNGTVTNCYSTGSVTSSTPTTDTSPYFWAYAGGLVGSQHSGTGTITNCYSTGSVNASSISSYAGGLMGSNGASIQKCYSTGQVSATGDSVYKGGLTGYSSAVTPTACFWDTQTSGTTDGAGNVNPDPAGVVGKTTVQMKTLTTFTAAPANWDFTNEMANGTNDIWRMCADGVDYPRLNWESIDGDFACPDGVAIEDLDYFVGRWLLNNCTSANNYCGGGDVDASGVVDLADYAVLAGHWLEGI